MKMYGILLGGGSGTRMKADKNKYLLKVNGKEIGAYSMEIFEKLKMVEKVVIVRRQEDHEEILKIIQKNKFKKFNHFAESGKERQDSVWNGMQKVKELGAREGDIVAVHDLARPFMEERMLLEAIEILEKNKEIDSVIPGIPAVDTIKQIQLENQQVEKTLERKKLVQVQTPQVQNFQAFWNAISKAQKEGYYGTDCSSLIEWNSGKVRVIAGSKHNIKITYPEDLLHAEEFTKQTKKN